jgi:hypothetical protein
MKTEAPSQTAPVGKFTEQKLGGSDSWPPLTLQQHYEYAVHWNNQGPSWAEWTATAEVLWRAFCMSWVTVAWAMLVGKE